MGSHSRLAYNLSPAHVDLLLCCHSCSPTLGQRSDYRLLQNNSLRQKATPPAQQNPSWFRSIGKSARHARNMERQFGPDWRLYAVALRRQHGTIRVIDSQYNRSRQYCEGSNAEQNNEANRLFYFHLIHQSSRSFLRMGRIYSTACA